MSAGPVLREDRGGAAILTLNRPQKLNALDDRMIDGLMAELDAIEEDNAIGAVILTGAGRAFSAGADIAGIAAYLAAGVDAAVKGFVGRGQALTRRIESFPKPVIAAVNGLAHGGGCEIVEAAPLALACEEATFAKPEIRLGFPPTFGSTQRLPRLIGRKRGLRMILTGEPIAAGEALHLGLVGAVLPREKLLPAAIALAERILAMPPRAERAALAAVTRGLNATIDEGLAIEALCFAGLAASDDAREGVAAFLERRSPRFTGR